MTDEKFVAAWLERDVGKSFRRKHRTWSALIRKQLTAGALDTCFDEGMPQCSCKDAKLGEGIQFYLQEGDFIQICQRCDSWTVFEGKKKRRGGK